MELFILSFLIFLLAALGMAAGFLLKGSALQGTCATLDTGLHGKIRCAFCPVRLRGAPGRCGEGR